MRIQRRFSHVKRLEDLRDTTILLIGFWEMGCQDWEVIAKCIGMSNRKILYRLGKSLRTSKNPIVRRYVDEGLPPGVFRYFPFPVCKIRCPLCGAEVSAVPCPKCSMRGMGEPARPMQAQRETLPPPPKRATNYRPGSMEKIALMQMRLSRGERLFHPKDRTIQGKDADHECEQRN